MEYLLAVILGLVFGSFISMLTHRLPQVYQENALNQWKAISLGKSKCPHCQAPLPAQQLIPIFSWIFNLGKCHNCKTHISWRYPLTELISAILVVLAVYKFGFNSTAFFASFFLLMLLAIATIDLEHFLILDSLSYPLIASGILLNYFGIFAEFLDALLGASLGYLSLVLVVYFYKLATGKVGMGKGDYKLFAALGAWLGLSALPQVLIIAASSALIFALALIALQKHKWNGKIPFAPYLAVAGLVSLFLGKDFLLEVLSALSAQVFFN